MNKTIRRLKAEIERRGGRIHIDENVPDEITEMFLREILACPDCGSRPQQMNRREAFGH